ncbi:TolC family protein [Rhodanobacter aciditrophus]|uniref:TolC family protein n=1 Tax=Rhodanobacter aciditrophus TaxID=1623218 RepID=A0ABW4B0C5_9GAMM
MTYRIFVLRKERGTASLWFGKPKNLAISCVLGLGAAFAQADTLTLHQAIDIAIQQDPWLQSSVDQEQSMRARSQSAQSLPDPKLSLGMANLPVDSFDINQEAMTQVVVGLSQQFPAGSTLSLSGSQFNVKADQSAFARINRKAQIRQVISNVWADMYRYDATLQVLKINEGLLLNLNESIAGNYSSAYNKVGQQALVNSELEIAKIGERSFQIQQALNQTKARLTQYLPQMASIKHYEFVELDQSGGAFDDSNYDLNLLTNHPMVRILDLQHQVSDFDRKIAQQQYKPQWGVNVSYGYRAEDANGRERADLASVGVSVSLPIFSSQRLDANVKAASSKSSAILYDRELKLNELKSQVLSLQADLALLGQRIALYTHTLIPGFQQSTDVALNAYRSNESGYRDVIMAQIAQMNAQIELIQLQSEQAKRRAEFEYLTTQSAEGAQQ